MSKKSEGVRYATSNAKPPRTLRRGLKSSTFLSPVQCDELKDLVEKHGGFPQGFPAAREEFAQIYEDNGRAWVRRKS